MCINRSNEKGELKGGVNMKMQRESQWDGVIPHPSFKA